MDKQRPVRLLPEPESVQAIAPVPDDPPVMFRWRGQTHRILKADGPERIEPEWWPHCGSSLGADSQTEPARDYYRVEDQDGRRYWLFRRGLHGPGAHTPAAHTPNTESPVWFLHGFFP
jgi:protein ImuB